MPMAPAVHFLLTAVGVIALLAALWQRGVACAIALLVGVAALFPVVFWNVDPVLGGGVLAFLGVACARRRGPSKRSGATCAVPHAGSRSDSAS